MLARGEQRSGRSTWRALALAVMALLSSALILPTMAGTMDIKWNSVPDSDLSGYRVYWGPTAGSHSNQKDAGKTTSTTLTNLTDCQIVYVAVRAYDTGGLESSNDSNSVKGYPRPVVSTVSPTVLHQGETLSFTVSGTNFDPGINGDSTRPPAKISVSGAGLTITATTIDACGTAHVTIQAAGNAALGFSSLTVSNPDITYTDPNNHQWPYGTLSNAFEVKAASDTTPPTVNSTSPAAGATSIPGNVTPTVTFSESMLASSITSSTVQLLDSSNNPVTQAGGSPSLSGAVATITPAAPLGAGQQYHIKVKGGSSGVKDSAGNAMTSDYTQNPAFTVSDSGSNGPPVVESYIPDSGSTGNSVTISEVTIRFDRDMSGLDESLQKTQLQKLIYVKFGSKALHQRTGSPEFRNGGRDVVVLLAEPMQAGAQYKSVAKISGGTVKKALEAHGHSDLYANQTFSSSGWFVEESVDRAQFQDSASGSSGDLLSDGSAPADSSAVPVTSVFRLTFQTAVVAATVNTTNFQIARGSKKATITATLESSTVVLLTPTQPLDPGAAYQIKWKTGKSGVLMQGPNGSIPSKTKQTVSFSTEVSAAELNGTIAVGEPSPAEER